MITSTYKFPLLLSKLFFFMLFFDSQRIIFFFNFYLSYFDFNVQFPKFLKVILHFLLSHSLSIISIKSCDIYIDNFISFFNKFIGSRNSTFPYSFYITTFYILFTYKLDFSPNSLTDGINLQSYTIGKSDFFINLSFVLISFILLKLSLIF